MKKLLMGMGVVTALTLTGCAEEKVELKPKDTEQMVEKEKLEQPEREDKTGTDVKALVEVNEKVLAKENDGLNLDITIPEVKGLNGFNQTALKLGTELEADVREAEKAIIEADPKSAIHAEGKMDYVTKLVTGQTISILIEAYSYSGGAHGTPYKEGLTYDLQTGAAIALAELFEGEGYVDELSELTKKKVETSDFKDLFFEPFTKIKQDQKFYLTPESLVLIFDPYEYTAGAAGSPEIVLAKSELKTFKDEYK